MSKVPFWATVNTRLLSYEKKAFTIGFLLPANVIGRKFGTLCSDIILRVRSLALQVKIKRESEVQTTPVTG